MAKMVLVALFPLVILTSITAVDFSKSLSRYLNTANILETLEFGVELGDFLAALQKERDMSSLYVSRLGKDNKENVLQVYLETDKTLYQLSSWPVSMFTSRRAFQTRDRYQLYLNRHRYELESNNLTAAEEIMFYSTDIEVFIGWMYAAIGDTESASIWKSLVGYNELIMASEYISREQGYGINFFTVGKFRDNNLYQLFMESQDSAKTHFDSARQYSIEAYTMYQESIQSNNDTLEELRHMRNEIKSNRSSKPEGSIELANVWFSKMSIYREVMRTTQKKLASRITVLLQYNSQQDMTNMITASVIVVGIVVISLIIATIVYNLTSNFQKYSASIVKK